MKVLRSSDFCVNESVKDEWTSQKLDMSKKISDFLIEYNNFIKNVSPSEWRKTGDYFIEFERLLTEIPSLKKITDIEKKIDWVKKELERTYTPFEKDIKKYNI